MNAYLLHDAQMAADKAFEDRETAREQDRLPPVARPVEFDWFKADVTRVVNVVAFRL